MNEQFVQASKYFSDLISDNIKSKKQILVTTHIDCDGLISGSIISKALLREGANCTLRAVNEMSLSQIEKMKNDPRNLHVITDLGGGFSKK